MKLQGRRQSKNVIKINSSERRRYVKRAPTKSEPPSVSNQMTAGMNKAAKEDRTKIKAKSRTRFSTGTKLQGYRSELEKLSKQLRKRNG